MIEWVCLDDGESSDLLRRLLVLPAVPWVALLAGVVGAGESIEISLRADSRRSAAGPGERPREGVVVMLDMMDGMNALNGDGIRDARSEIARKGML